VYHPREENGSSVPERALNNNNEERKRDSSMDILIDSLE
jgi:hypothetical protein